MSLRIITVLCALLALDGFLWVEVSGVSQARTVFLQSAAAHSVVVISYCVMMHLWRAKITIPALRFWLATAFAGLHGIAYTLMILIGQFLTATVLKEAYYWRKAEELLLTLLFN
ncbi:MAG: hypothetical protein IT364_03620 [Candidatus Hydrogenedentes bacterium]|nr:hypothetical protein [Candidatus Hydrogenedentota bacterium]